MVNCEGVDRQSLSEGSCRKGTWAKAERSGGTSQKSTRRRDGDRDRTDDEVTIRDPDREEGGEVNERLGGAKGEIKGRSVQASRLGEGTLAGLGPMAAQTLGPRGVKTPSLARRFVANAAAGHCMLLPPLRNAHHYSQCQCDGAHCRLHGTEDRKSAHPPRPRGDTPQATSGPARGESSWPLTAPGATRVQTPKAQEVSCIGLAIPVANTVGPPG
jgi:hypothetical protein